jgi:excisionase family DNA binding protein
MPDQENEPANRILHSAEEVAAMLNLSVSEIRELARDATIATVRIGRRVLFTRDDIDHFVHRHRTPAKST